MPRVPMFYGWWIVAAGFGIEFLIGALLFHTYGAYAVKLREEFGWSKTMLSAAFAMSRAESGILGPVQGWLTDRFGPRALVRVGMSVFGVGFLLFARIDGPVVFFLTFFMMAFRMGSSEGDPVIGRAPTRTTSPGRGVRACCEPTARCIRTTFPRTRSRARMLLRDHLGVRKRPGRNSDNRDPARSGTRREMT